MASNDVKRKYEVREIFEGNVFPRIIHCLLRDDKGNSLLAAVGIERSRYHLVYQVSQDFLRVFGPSRTANSQTKWYSKCTVIEWLESLCSVRRAIFIDPSQKLFDTEPSAEHVMSLMARFSNHGSPLHLERSSNSQPHNSAIVWSGDAWKCCQQLKHYSAFCRSQTTVLVHSFVFFMNEVGTTSLGYVEDLFEDKKANKLVRVRQFQSHEEMENLFPDLDSCNNEVFITSNGQVINAESIDGIAAVLTPNHFEECAKVLPRDLSSCSFVCHRQFMKNKIKPFRLCDLRGYPTQPILSSLTCPFPPPRNNQDSTEMGEGSASQEPVLHGRRSSHHSGDQVACDKKVVKHIRLKIKLTSMGPGGRSSYSAEVKPVQELNLKKRWYIRCNEEEAGRSKLKL